MNWLLEPLTYEFMQRGLLASVIVGVLCAVMGTYVVLRGMAFLGDAMAHAILPGVAIAYILKGDLLIGAGAAAVAIALTIGFFTKDGTVKGRYCHWYLVCGGIVAGCGTDQHHANLRRRLISHPLRECVGRQRR